jgi:hypothetical protein
MTDDREAMASEIQRLRKARDIWMIVAAVALVLTFLVLTPLSFLIYQWVDARETEAAQIRMRAYKVQSDENQALHLENQALRKQLQERLGK